MKVGTLGHHICRKKLGKKQRGENLPCKRETDGAER